MKKRKGISYVICYLSSAMLLCVLLLFPALSPAQPQPRTTISINRYEGVADPVRKSKFGEFRAILKRRINRLAEEFASMGPEYDYLNDLILSETGGVAGSSREKEAYWDTTNSLQLLSGGVFNQDDTTIVFTDIYLGRLSKFLRGKTIEMELKITAQEYRRTRDLYTAVTLYALAMDAVGKQSANTIMRYLSEARSYVKDLQSSGPIALELESAIDKAAHELSKGTLKSP